MNLIQSGQNQHKDVLVLCASCGGTVLQVKNKLREDGFADVTLRTVTENQKYLPDLQTVSDYAVCDQFQNITAVCKDKLFDYILIEVDLQGIVNHQALLQDVIKLLQDDGQLIFTAANEAFYLNLINLLNGDVDCDDKFSRCAFNIEKLCNFIANEGFADMQIYFPQVPIPEEHRSLFENLKNVSFVKDKKLLDQLYGNRRAIIAVKGKAQFKNVLFYPGYDSWLNDVIFNDNILVNSLGVNTGKNWWGVLKEELEKRKFNLLTIDKGSIEQSEYIIFCDIPKSYNNPFFSMMYHQVYQGEQFFKEWLARGKGSRMIFILAKSPFVMPENYDKSFHQHANFIFTYLDDLVDNRKYFKYFNPQPLPFKNPYTTSYADKQMYILIAGNKFSNVPGELYSERRKAIEYFEKNLNEEFDLYGSGWETTGYKCYKGQTSGKLAALSKYKYCICYENGASNGYITEKIFNCFFAGCVPIYLGAPNITDYIPANTFIDRRRFVSYEEMHSYINCIHEDEYNMYLANTHQFLYSDVFQKFNYANFAQTFVQILEKIQ